MSAKISGTNKFLIVIAGPTGIGKSDLALKLAQKYNAELFSADSRQIYKEMSIGTAKPNRVELSTVSHHFVEELSINESYSVGRYMTDFNQRLKSYFSKKDIAIVVGGTGLYIHAIFEGVDTFPDVPSEVSEAVADMYRSEGLYYLQQELLNLDPQYYHQIDIQNPRRIVRALEVIKASGLPYSTFLGQKPNHANYFNSIQILLNLPREILYKKINDRVDHMIDCGLEEEARSLYPMKHLRALDTVGYKEMFDFFDGKIDRLTAIQLIKQNTRRYAKRQITWFKKYGNWSSFDPCEYNKICQFIDDSVNI